MAWELQAHMHAWIAPSVYKAALESGRPRFLLATWFANQRWDESQTTREWDDLRNSALRTMSRARFLEPICEDIAEKAIENATTSNGGWEVYLDEGGWDSVPWCSEDETNEWYV